MIRKAIIVILSLLTLATSGECVATRIVPRAWVWYRNDTTWVEVCLHRGAVNILIIEDTGFPMFPVFIESFAYARNLVRQMYGSNTTFRNLTPLPAGMKARGSTFPILPLVAVFAAYPAWCLVSWFRHRPKPGHCQRCGYNLKGNTSGKCSECGTETG